MTATHDPIVWPVSLPRAAAAIFAVLAVPASFLNAPVWVMIVEGFVIAGTITALALVYQSRRLA